LGLVHRSRASWVLGLTTLNLRKLPPRNELPSIRNFFYLLLPPSPSRYRLSSAFVVCSIKHSRFPKVVERKFYLLADCYDQWSRNELPSIRKVFDLLRQPSPSRYRLSLAFVVCSIKHSRFPKVVERKFYLLADCYDQWSRNELPSIRKVFDLLRPPSPSRYRLSLAFVVCSIKHSRFPKVVERKFCLLADFRLLLCGALWKLCLWLNVVGKDIEINKVQER
jgi:hypothetical protein